MANKKTTPIAPPTMLTLTLPNDGPMPRTGTLLAQKGDVGQLRRFEYRSLAEVSTALKEALLALHELAKQPSTMTVNPAAESPEDDDQVESDTPDEPAEFQEAIDEPFVSANEEVIAAVEIPITDQLSLF
ncbi:MAG: hypothetical protein HY862_02740 [Chloroflexi bacterium]|nr:hypothetical protein [Chloroflexota bacterium]